MELKLTFRPDMPKKTFKNHILPSYAQECNTLSQILKILSSKPHSNHMVSHPLLLNNAMHALKGLKGCC